jgi:TPR repeat protein
MALTLLDRLAARTPQRALSRGIEAAAARDWKRATALFAIAAEAGLPDAQFRIGECYLAGTGQVRSLQEAARWYLRAANAGHIESQCRLASLYLHGIDGERLQANASLFAKPSAAPAEVGADFDLALQWARRAAEAGSADAQAIVGYILANGPEPLRDPDAALHYYQRSADQGWPQGHLGLGTLLMRGADTAEKTFAAKAQIELAV